MRRGLFVYCRRTQRRRQHNDDRTADGSAGEAQQAPDGGVDDDSEQTLDSSSTLLAGTTQPGMLVVDPTAGSGTTGISAMGFGAYFCGYDLNAEFCKLAQRRLDAQYEEFLQG